MLGLRLGHTRGGALSAMRVVLATAWRFRVASLWLREGVWSRCPLSAAGRLLGLEPVWPQKQGLCAAVEVTGRPYATMHHDAASHKYQSMEILICVTCWPLLYTLKCIHVLRRHRARGSAEALSGPNGRLNARYRSRALQ